MKKEVYKIAVNSSETDFECPFLLEGIFELDDYTRRGEKLEFDSISDAEDYLNQYFTKIADGVFLRKNGEDIELYQVVKMPYKNKKEGEFDA